MLVAFVRGMVRAMDDELTPRGEQRREEAEAWFLAAWEELDDAERDAIADFVMGLHEAGLRRRPGEVAWLRARSH